MSKCRLHACVTAVASDFVVFPNRIYRDRLAKFCRYTKLYVYMHICILYAVIGLNIRTLLGPVPTRMWSENRWYKLLICNTVTIRIKSNIRCGICTIGSIRRLLVQKSRRYAFVLHSAKQFHQLASNRTWKRRHHLHAVGGGRSVTLPPTSNCVCISNFAFACTERCDVKLMHRRVSLPRQLPQFTARLSSNPPKSSRKTAPRFFLRVSVAIRYDTTRNI